MTRHLSLAALVAAFVLTLAVAAHADHSLTKVQKSGEITIGFAAHYPPFESKNEKTGLFEGFDVDMANALAKDMGLTPKFVDAEWQGLLGGLMKGDFDVLITCMSKSETRGQNVSFTDVYYRLADVMVVGKNAADIADAEGLRGKVVGVQMGSGSEQLVDKLEGLKEIRRYNYNPEAFLDLKAGRIDALVVGYAYAVNQIKADPSYKVTGKPLAEAEIVMVLPKNSQALTQQLNKSLAAIRADGSYDAAAKRWLSVN